MAPALWLLLAVGLELRVASAQHDSLFVVELYTNAPHASVYVDDALVGRASQRFLRLPYGSQILKLVLAGKDNWSIPPVSAELHRTSAGDTATIRLNFPYRYRFESTPYGAMVFSGAESHVLGRTPLETHFDSPLDGPVTFELDGHWPEQIEPGNELWNIHAVRMRPVDTDAEISSRLAWDPPKHRKKWIDYAALGTAAVAGVMAVHFKFKADRRFDRYRQTGDPDLRAEVKRYDVYSGVALGFMQAGVGLFAVRLILR